jgi:dTDP-4-amino-4,6-dideoxygalactose transaminase
MNVPFVDLKTQFKNLEAEIRPEIDWVLENTAFVLGNKVGNFEEKFAAYCGRKHCVAVNSGTSALHLALLASGIKAGDEVITVPNTFIATAEAISYCGAKPVFVDIDPVSFNMDVSKIESAITEKTKFILPVHLYGQAVDMGPVLEIASKHNLKVVEDACQSHGSEYKGKRLPYSDIGCFSFYPGKNLGAYGEGGAVVTDDEEVADKIRAFRDHGQTKKYYHDYVGFNARMSGFQGAVLGVKLNHLDSWIDGRRKAAELYGSLLNGVVEIPAESSGNKHVFHLYVIRVKEREKFMEFMSSKGVGVGIHYPIPLHMQKAYSSLGYKMGDFPVSEEIANEIVSLPMYPEISEEQVSYVCDCVKEFFS